MFRFLLLTSAMLLSLSACAVPADSLPTSSPIYRQPSTETIAPTPDSSSQLSKYIIQQGDTIISLSSQFKIEPQTILWSNWDLLSSDPHILKPGIELIIPPVDGAVHTWIISDSLASVAEQYSVLPDTILAWSGNSIYVHDSQLEISVGDRIFIPDGQGPVPSTENIDLTTAQP